jgi:hypothetical protein
MGAIMAKPTIRRAPSFLPDPALVKDPPKREFFKDRGGTWLMLAAIFLASTVILWHELSRVESEGGALRVTWLVVELYELGGIWVPTLICGAAGLGFLALGIVERFNLIEDE